MAEIEAELAFKHFEEPAPLPSANSPVNDIEVTSNWLGKVRRLPVRRGFIRSDNDAAEYRQGLRIGMPRVLSMFTLAPMFRSYFELLGMPQNHIVWSDPTTEELFSLGCKYGSVDPCFPSKVVQAHFHNLLFDKHTTKRSGPLDYIFFPGLTHIPSFVSHALDYTSCTIVAGTPKVMRAAFTKELDFFGRAGIEYVDTVLNLSEAHLFNEQMWQAWGDRLRISRDEHDFALQRAWEALAGFEQMLEEKGRGILEEVAREGRMAVLLLGRPYHADAGINHDIPSELQSLEYPILTIRSIPKDPQWLRPYFEDDLQNGYIEDVFDIRDVWPENFSVNSTQKIWGSKFAARHPNVAVLDLSSFKCGHDSPTYGLMDEILKAAGTPRLIMHDLDANKAVGSIAIRTGTFAYTLSRHAEELQKTTEKDRKIRLAN
jgi:predicted nucleotide-binding protein (sugar kinase/HSP70/actin superfamily)